MKLSVIIPTYDTADMTLACCASVMAALPPDSEVIVVDDASSDDTASRIAAAFPPITVLRLPQNRGYSAAVNAGVAASRGEIVLLLNSDTRVFALAPFVEAFSRDAKLGVAGAQLVNADGSLQWSGGKKPTALWMVVAVSGVLERRRPRRLSGRRPAAVVGDGSGTLPAQPARTPALRPIDWVSGAAIAIRRSVWDAIGPMREDFRFYAQDLDFCIRAQRAGWSVRLIDDVRVEHRHGATIAPDRQSAPELLWLDLLTWGRGEYGDAWARRTRRAMIVAAFIFSRDRRGYDALRKSVV